MKFYDGHCAYCDKSVMGSYHIDHILPISAGGTSKFENLAIACPKCNLHASNKVFSTFSDKQEFVQRLRGMLI